MFYRSIEKTDKNNQFSKFRDSKLIKTRRDVFLGSEETRKSTSNKLEPKQYRNAIESGTVYTHVCTISVTATKNTSNSDKMVSAAGLINSPHTLSRGNRA